MAGQYLMPHKHHLVLHFWWSQVPFCPSHTPIFFAPAITAPIITFIFQCSHFMQWLWKSAGTRNFNCSVFVLEFLQNQFVTSAKRVMWGNTKFIWEAFHLTLWVEEVNLLTTVWQNNGDEWFTGSFLLSINKKIIQIIIIKARILKCSSQATNTNIYLLQ